MRRNAETVSVRVREETYSEVKALAKEKGTKAVNIFDDMLRVYRIHLTQGKIAPESFTGTAKDASHRTVGEYINNKM
tara:strand:- start:1618 stop:1848 length:231 start_codon:yes stop_codon:yes gene_type:complete